MFVFQSKRITGSRMDSRTKWKCRTNRRSPNLIIQIRQNKRLNSRKPKGRVTYYANVDYYVFLSFLIHPYCTVLSDMCPFNYVNVSENTYSIIFLSSRSYDLCNYVQVSWPSLYRDLSPIDSYLCFLSSNVWFCHCCLCFWTPVLADRVL